MEISTVKFNKLDQPEFFKELRKRVNKYFEENGIYEESEDSLSKECSAAE